MSKKAKQEVAMKAGSILATVTMGPGLVVDLSHMQGFCVAARYKKWGAYLSKVQEFIQVYTFGKDEMFVCVHGLLCEREPFTSKLKKS